MSQTCAVGGVQSDFQLKRIGTIRAQGEEVHYAAYWKPETLME